MVFILYDDITVSISPEIDYGGGATMAFHRGYFLFDAEEEEKKDDLAFWVSEAMGVVTINGKDFSINHKLKYENPIRAEIVFLKLKLNEWKRSSFDFFLPKTFKKKSDRYDELLEQYPEYGI